MFLWFDSKVVESHITKKKLYLNYTAQLSRRLFSDESTARMCNV